MRGSLEKERARRVAAAEKRAGIREGVHRMQEGDRWLFVFTEVVFYPKERWFVSDLGEGPLMQNATNRRPLTDEMKAKLEDWL